MAEKSEEIGEISAGIEVAGSGQEIYIEVLKSEEDNNQELLKQDIEKAFDFGVELADKLQDTITELKKHYKPWSHPQFGAQLFTSFSIGVITKGIGLSIDHNLLYELITDAAPTPVLQALREFLTPELYVVYPGEVGLKINENSISPDATMKILVSEKTAPLLYVLYVCYNRRTTGVKFLYHCIVDGKNFITSPYFVEDMKTSDPVRCAEALNITPFLRRTKPVPAIRRALRRIQSSNLGMENGFFYDDFSWNRVGQEGKFSIRSPKRNDSSNYLYWMEKDGFPAVTFTRNTAQQLELKITDT